jgi:hypothetical protein
VDLAEYFLLAGSGIYLLLCIAGPRVNMSQKLRSWEVGGGWERENVSIAYVHHLL